MLTSTSVLTFATFAWVAAPFFGVGAAELAFLPTFLDGAYTNKRSDGLHQPHVEQCMMMLMVC